MIAYRAAYVASFNTASPRPNYPGAYDPDISKAATAIDRSRSKAKPSALKADHDIFESIKRGVKLFITKVVNKTGFKDIKDAELLYTDVSAAALLNHLRSRSGGLNAIYVIDITAEMMTYYKEVSGIPEHINMIEDDQLKSKCDKLPIPNKKFVAIATKAVLASDDPPRTTKQWEDINAPNKM